MRQGAPEPSDAQELQIYLEIYGTSYDGATVVWVAAIDPRVKCTVSVVGIGNGARWMRSVRRPDEYYDLLERSAEDRTRRAFEGASGFVERSEILLPDRRSAELGMAARRNNPAAVTKVPLEFVDDTLSFNPEWVVDKIAPRPVLFITSDNDRLVPPAESEAMYARAGRTKETRHAQRLRRLRGLCARGVSPGDGRGDRLVPTIYPGALGADVTSEKSRGRLSGRREAGCRWLPAPRREPVAPPEAAGQTAW
jgi:hypothetical protein